MCIMIKKSVVDQICRRWCLPQTVRKANLHHGERGHFALGGAQAVEEAQKDNVATGVAVKVIHTEGEGKPPRGGDGGESRLMMGARRQILLSR